MRNLPAGLLNLLNSGETRFFIADLFTFTLVDGTVRRWTNYGADVTISGNTWIHNGPLISRSRVKWSNTMNVDDLEINFSATMDMVLGTIPLLQAIALRFFDGAKVELDRVYSSPTVTTWQGPVNLFTGIVGEISDLGRASCKITVDSMVKLLTTPIPRKLVSPSCPWVLGDAGCTLSLASLQVSGALTSGSNKSVLQTNLTKPGPLAAPTAAPSLSAVAGHSIPAQTYYVKYTYVAANGETSPSPESSLAVALNDRISIAAIASPGGSGLVGWNAYIGLSPGNEELQNSTPIAFGTGYTAPDYQQGPTQGVGPPLVNQSGYFALGYLTFTSGANDGLTVSIAEYGAGGVVTLVKPLPFAPSTGDTFIATPGDDKTLTTCTYKFNNRANNGSFPFVPTPETAI